MFFVHFFNMFAAKIILFVVDFLKILSLCIANIWFLFRIFTQNYVSFKGDFH